MTTSAHDGDAGEAFDEAMAQITSGAAVAIGADANRAIQTLAEAMRGRDRPLYAIRAEDRRHERSARLQAAVATRSAHQLRVIDPPTIDLAATWHEPIGLLRLSGCPRSRGC